MALLLLVVMPWMAMAGCSQSARGSGALRAESFGDGSVTLPANYTTAVYAPGEANVATFYLADAPLDDLLKGNVTDGQIVHIELLWLPRAGRTPMDASAANCSVRHVILVGDEYGIYGGAGFARAGAKPGSDRITVSVPRASLTLLESSPGFEDALSPARLTGEFTAVLDPALTRRVGFAASQIVTNLVGQRRYVQVGEADHRRGVSIAREPAAHPMPAR